MQPQVDLRSRGASHRARLLDITEVARRTGVPASTLRFYEEKRLITSVGRRGLRRLFEPSVLERLALIGLGRAAGFSLEEIARMFAPDGRPRIDRRMLAAKADELDLTIAKLTKLAHGLDMQPELSGGLQEMGERAEEMVRVALDSFAARDVDRARSLVDLDELIDRTNRQVVERVLAARSEENKEWGMRMIVVSRCIERIGDNAVDIGEQTVFVVTGEFHEFSDASH